jgi:hypothetical protein
MGNCPQFGKLRMRLGNCPQNPGGITKALAQHTFDKQQRWLTIQPQQSAALNLRPFLVEKFKHEGDS